jgi:hypothetical protein
MSKTLSESAAEILRASMNAGKEPMQSMPAPVNDLGGATPEDDYSGGPGHGQKDMDPSVGIAAAKAVNQAAKPGTPGVPAEPMKKSASTSEVVADSEDGVKAVAKLTKEDEEVSAEAEVIEEEESEEEILEAKKNWVKGKVKDNMGSMKEDVDALFNGESLSEDFRVKATLIFEAAVSSRVEKIVEEVLNENEEILSQAYDEIKKELSEKVDEYLDYVVAEWITENQVAIESGLRAELAEDFINGLKNLFAEHYIEMPEEKIDLAEELAQKVVSLEEKAALVEEKLAAATKELNEAKKYEAIRRICEGLTEVQVEKMKSLAEGVEFTAEGDFEHKLAVIRENYFPTKKIVSEVKVVEETSEQQPEVETSSVMAHYVKAISKTLPK